MNMASAGNCVCPVANGQMPASARNSVDLPLPDGPLSKMLSPGPACSDAPLSSVAPVGSVKVKSRTASVSAASGCALFATELLAACARPCCATALILSSKLVSRSVVARQAARLL